LPCGQALSGPTPACVDRNGARVLYLMGSFTGHCHAGEYAENLQNYSGGKRSGQFRQPPNFATRTKMPRPTHLPARDPVDQSTGQLLLGSALRSCPHGLVITIMLADLRSFCRHMTKVNRTPTVCVGVILCNNCISVRAGKHTEHEQRLHMREESSLGAHKKLAQSTGFWL
jgi:hypothetical protein